MTFLEALRAKTFNLKSATQLRNVWRLNDEKTCVAIMAHAVPDAEDIIALAEAHDHCQRMLVIAPAAHLDEQLMWAHSQAVEAVISDEEGLEKILEAVDPHIIITGKGAEELVPENYRNKLHQYA